MDKNIIASLVGLSYLPFAFYFTYLVLIHIKATELMWFVWIVTILLGVIVGVVMNMIKEN